MNLPKKKRDAQKVEDAMSKTFANQRYLINIGKHSIVDIQKEWPFLLEENFILKHYKELMNQDIHKLFSEGILVKGKIIYHIYHTLWHL